MIFFFFKNKYGEVRKIKAFTLLETLASIAIISAVIIGPLSVAVNSSVYARQTKDIMTVTYLAEESLELLHNQYDSMYIACMNAVAPCDASQPSPGETIGETAWRLFKARLLTDLPTCALPNGCAYDFIDMSENFTSSPQKYTTTTGSNCSSFSLMIAPMTVNSVTLDTLRRFYVCGNVPAHKAGATLLSNPYYTRKIIIDSVPTFEIGSPQYHDDLRITARMSFKRSNGANRNIEVIDFLHARP